MLGGRELSWRVNGRWQDEARHRRTFKGVVNGRLKSGGVAVWLWGNGDWEVGNHTKLDWEEIATQPRLRFSLGNSSGHGTLGKFAPGTFLDVALVSLSIAGIQCFILWYQ